MGVIQEIDHEGIHYWAGINHELKAEVKTLKRYANLFCKKVSDFQYIYLKLYDLNNQDYTDMKTGFFKQIAQFSKQPNVLKLNKRFFRLIKNRINRIKKNILSEVIVENKEGQEVRTIVDRLNEVIQSGTEIRNAVQNFSAFRTNMIKLRANLIQQSKSVTDLEETFLEFYGKKAKEDVTEIKRELKDVNVKMEILKKLIREEARFSLGLTLSQSISHWKVECTEHLKSTTLFNDLKHLLITSGKSINLLREAQAETYHACISTKEKIYPLSENLSPHRFYVCARKREYAIVIKRAQVRDLQIRLNVFRIEIPISVFEKLFIADHNSGNPKINGSEEAYENAYYLPVSRYPLFNYYHSLKIIRTYRN